MILIKTQHYNEILRHAIKVLPNESCGLIGGRIEENSKIVEKVYPLNNVDSSPKHFSINPIEQFSVVKDMRKNGLVMIGNFHSHPKSPARPSEEDKRLAFDNEVSYFILSLMNDERPVLKSFKIIGQLVREEEIIII